MRKAALTSVLRHSSYYDTLPNLRQEEFNSIDLTVVWWTSEHSAASFLSGIVPLILYDSWLDRRNNVEDLFRGDIGVP